MAHSLRFRRLGDANTRIFRCYSLGTYPKGGGFSCALSFDAAARAFSRGLATRAEAPANSVVHLDNTLVFLRMTLRHATRTLFSCSRYYQSLRVACAKSGHTGAKASTRLTPWVAHRRGLRRAEARILSSMTLLPSAKFLVSVYAARAM